ncbi:MAG: AAA family ATPase [candidate division KSB1 bacterium]|nr:AAA family ATPase [candidate division KSB1 bacterium]
MPHSHETYEKAIQEDFPCRPLPEGSVLRKLGKDLTHLASRKKLLPVWGRDKEIHHLIEILGRKTKPNPIILGEAGVGKTALVEKLAQEIVEHPDGLPIWIRGSKIVEISYVAIASQGSSTWDEYLRNVRKAFEEAAAKPIILFIDEIHQLWAFPISISYIKPMLARGDVRIIGATTRQEYHRFLETESALMRRFYPVYLDEPSKEEIVCILQTLLPVYQQDYRLTCEDTNC